MNSLLRSLSSRSLRTGILATVAIVLVISAGWGAVRHLQAAVRPDSVDTSPASYLPFVSAPPPQISFAIIGDYGDDSQAEGDVADLVKSWQPDFIITTGDNNYPDGEASTIDTNIGQYYQEFVGSYSGSFGPGASSNNFYPSLGNHDWNTPNAQPYLDYFVLPDAGGLSSSGNERYYDFVRGPIHFFAIDSDSDEPDGRDSSSIQAAWLQAQLAQSTSPWQVVYMHHPPYSSSSVHGNEEVMQWPYQAWRADAVLAGHDHTYERIILNGLPYFVNGLGGRSRYGIGSPVPGSVVRYNDDYGAMLVTASELSITFQFISRQGELIDRFTLDQ